MTKFADSFVICAVSGFLISMAVTEGHAQPLEAKATIYKANADSLRRLGISLRLFRSKDSRDAFTEEFYGSAPSFPNKCYFSPTSDLSVSDELLERYEKRGFSLATLCLAMESPWVRFNPETGESLRVVSPTVEGSDGMILLDVPDCFKDGKPFLHCKHSYHYDAGTEVDPTDANIHERAVKVDKAVQELLTSGRYSRPCPDESSPVSSCPISIDQVYQDLRPTQECYVEHVPACAKKLITGRDPSGFLVAEGEGYSLPLPTEGFTGYGKFDFSPNLPGGYAYRIGSPEGDEEANMAELPLDAKLPGED